jgi:hypothetical protein
MNTKIIIAVVVCVLITSIFSVMYMRSKNAEKKRAERAAAEAAYQEQVQNHERAVAAARSAAEQQQRQQTEGAKPTDTPAAQKPQVVYVADPYTHPMWPRERVYIPPRQRIPLYPGGNIDAVVGRKKDAATLYLMTTYPSLALRVVSHGTLVTYEARSDRVTVVYDPYTERVISAIIG